MAKAPADLRSLARSHTERAVQVLAGIMNNDKSPPVARVKAAEVLMDRGWGKATQPVGGDPDHPLIIQEIVRKIVHVSSKSDADD